jgi:hypothetical protein
VRRVQALRGASVWRLGRILTPFSCPASFWLSWSVVDEVANSVVPANEVDGRDIGFAQEDNACSYSVANFVEAVA